MNLTILIFQFIDGMKSITTALFEQAPLHLKPPPRVSTMKARALSISQIR